MGRIQSRYSLAIGPEFSQIQLDPEMGFLRLYSSPLLIGITGSTKSGKTTFANYLVSLKGFLYVSPSQTLVELSKQLGYIEPTWNDLGELAEKLRIQYGNDYLLKKSFEKVDFSKINRVVIDGILHPDEADLLLSYPNSHLLAFKAESTLKCAAASLWFGQELEDIQETIAERDETENVLENTKDPKLPIPNVHHCITKAGQNCVEIDAFNDENVRIKGFKILKDLVGLAI